VRLRRLAAVAVYTEADLGAAIGALAQAGGQRRVTGILTADAIVGAYLTAHQESRPVVGNCSVRVTDDVGLRGPAYAPGR
jgi:hypothetical protein